MRTLIREVLQAATIFVAAFMILHFSIQNFRIDGASMHPALINTQHVIASKVAYLRIEPSSLIKVFPFGNTEDGGSSFFTSLKPVYGDVVAFSYPIDPSKNLVKRVIGLPGDVIAIESGYVIRNGQKLPESYVVSRDRRTISEVTVPADSYYVLGDNRRRSTDSRDWGFVPSDHIIGRAWLSYWPSDRLSFIHPLW